MSTPPLLQTLVDVGAGGPRGAIRRCQFKAGMTTALIRAMSVHAVSMVATTANHKEFQT